MAYDYFDIKLTEEQEESVSWALNTFNSEKGCILGLATGYGKTITSIATAISYMESHDRTLTFIICPKAANNSFKKELSRQHKYKWSIITTSENKINAGSMFFLFNYSRLDPMLNLLKQCYSKGIKVLLVADEVHTLKSRDSQVSKKMNYFRPYFDKVLGLTATPLLNHIEDIYYVSEFVCPGFFPSYLDFESNYINYREKTVYLKGGRRRKIKEVVSYKNLNLLSRYVTRILLVKRKTYDIDFIYKQTSLTEAESLVYKSAAEGILNGVDEDTDPKTFSARLHDLQRVADGSHPDYPISETPSKTKLLISVLQEIVSRGEGTIIYTDYESSYEKLGEIISLYKGSIGFRNLYYITGKVPTERRTYVENNHGAKDIIIITRAGSASINLQKVNNIIFYDIPFAVGSIIQSTGRITRTDTKYEKQHCYYLECVDTIDSYKRFLLQSNADLIRKILGGEVGNDGLPDSLDTNKKAFYKNFLKNKLLWKRI